MIKSRLIFLHLQVLYFLMSFFFFFDIFVCVVFLLVMLLRNAWCSGDKKVATSSEELHKDTDGAKTRSMSPRRHRLDPGEPRRLLPPLPYLYFIFRLPLCVISSHFLKKHSNAFFTCRLISLLHIPTTSEEPQVKKLLVQHIEIAPFGSCWRCFTISFCDVASLFISISFFLLYKLD